MLIGGEKENDVRLKAKKHHVAPFKGEKYHIVNTFIEF